MIGARVGSVYHQLIVRRNFWGIHHERQELEVPQAQPAERLNKPSAKHSKPQIEKAAVSAVFRLFVTEARYGKRGKLSW